MEADDEASQLRYASALAHWADAGGHDAEVLWDICCTEAFGVAYDKARYRDIMTLSGGEQKRLVLQVLLHRPDQVLILDEPDNYLDVPSKRWLENRLNETAKTVLYGMSGTPSSAGAGRNNASSSKNWSARWGSPNPQDRSPRQPVAVPRSFDRFVNFTDGGR